MQLVMNFVEFLLHFDRHLREMLEWAGPWTYVFLFLIVFCETGLVVTPFLPGDSLLFAAGALAGQQALSLTVLLVGLSAAAILGDAVNFAIGSKIERRVLETHHIPWVKQRHLERTHAFFERYGNKTIVLARFVPIVRTFAPFVAGIGQMSYRQFAVYNVVGGCAWVLICTLAGFFFGGWQLVQDNFPLFVLGIVGVSLLPIVIEAWLQVRRGRAVAASSNSAPDPHEPLSR